MISADEHRNQCSVAMGKELGAIYCDLNDHLLDILLLWKQYEQLFCIDEDTVHTLNESAPTFFRVVQAQLWDGVILGISRLTDPPFSCRRQNLSIKSIPPLIGDLTAQTKVNEAIDEAVIKSDFTRTHRNKRIAHNDLVHIQDRTANPLPPSSREEINNALASICAVLEILNAHYRESTMLYNDQMYEGGAESVVYLLRQARNNG